MIGAAGELVLPRRVIPQPTPEVSGGGDCGACVFGGIFGMTVPEVYEFKGDVCCIGIGEMQRMLRVAAIYKKADRFIEDPARWAGHTTYEAFGRPGHLDYLSWFNYVRMAIDAGYYGLAQVDFARTGGRAKGGTDHWVMICGARTEGTVIDKKLTGEVLVSCSARSTGVKDEWVEAQDFLKNRGGYNILFARPLCPSYRQVALATGPWQGTISPRVSHPCVWVPTRKS